MWARVRREPAVAVALFGVIAVLLGILREQSIAYRLGLSVATDAFYLGMTIISFLPGLVSAACGGVLAPHHARTVKESGELRGKTQLEHILVICLGLGAAAVLLLGVAGAIGYTYGAETFTAEKRQLTLSMVAALALAVPALCFSSAAVSALNVLGRYALGGGSAAIAPLTAVLALRLVPAGAWSLVGGVVVGLNLQALLLAWALSKEGVVVVQRPSWRQAMPLLHNMGLLAVGALAACITTVVIQAMVASTGAHGVSAYTFGTKITIAYSGLSVLVLSTVITPIFAARAAGLPYSRRRLRIYLWLGFVATVGGTVVFGVGADQVIRLFWGRGAFSGEDVMAVAAVQRVAALQMPAYLMLFLSARAVQSYRDAKFDSRMRWIQAGTTMGLACALLQVLGITGIILANVVSYVLSAACYWLRYQHHRRLAFTARVGDTGSNQLASPAA